MNILTIKQIDKEILEKQSFINKIKLKMLNHRLNNIYNKMISKEKITREDIQCKSI